MDVESVGGFPPVREGDVCVDVGVDVKAFAAPYSGGERTHVYI